MRVKSQQLEEQKKEQRNADKPVMFTAAEIKKGLEGYHVGLLNRSEKLHFVSQHVERAAALLDAASALVDDTHTKEIVAIIKKMLDEYGQNSRGIADYLYEAAYDLQTVQVSDFCDPEF